MMFDSIYVSQGSEKQKKKKKKNWLDQLKLDN